MFQFHSGPIKTLVIMVCHLGTLPRVFQFHSGPIKTWFWLRLGLLRCLRFNSLWSD